MEQFASYIVRAWLDECSVVRDEEVEDVAFGQTSLNTAIKAVGSALVTVSFMTSVILPTGTASAAWPSGATQERSQTTASESRLARVHELRSSIDTKIACFDDSDVSDLSPELLEKAEQAVRAVASRKTSGA